MWGQGGGRRGIVTPILFTLPRYFTHTNTHTRYLFPALSVAIPWSRCDADRLVRDARGRSPERRETRGREGGSLRRDENRPRFIIFRYSGPL